MMDFPDGLKQACDVFLPFGAQLDIHDVMKQN